MAYTVVGQALGRVEGPAKVSGQAQYAADVLRPGMPWSKTLRSPLPHVRIVRLDTSVTACLPGVCGVRSCRQDQSRATSAVFLSRMWL